jgi:hypothetical protein
MAVYLWMRYSYRWEPGPDDPLVAGTYVALPVLVHDDPEGPVDWSYTLEGKAYRLWLVDRSNRWVLVVTEDDVDLETRSRLLAAGRVVTTPIGRATRAIDTTRHRLCGQSVAGLVVGAMGVFVFATALNAWLGERRACRDAE